MLHFVYALDADGYARAEVFDAVNDHGETEYCIGFGVCGCLYDSVIDGFDTFDDAIDTLRYMVEEEYDQTFDPGVD
jgi:hypothetical protein